MRYYQIVITALRYCYIHSCDSTVDSNTIHTCVLLRKYNWKNVTTGSIIRQPRARKSLNNLKNERQIPRHNENTKQHWEIKLETLIIMLQNEI